MRFSLIGVLVTGIVLSICGITTGVDGIVQWVFAIVDGIGWSEIYKPLYNPEPMDTYAYRPMSVVLLKAFLALTGGNETVMTAIHTLILVAFGVVGRQFLIVHGFSAGVASAAAISSMAMPSVLFSAWICVEFDLLGAVFALAAATNIVRFSNSHEWRHKISFIVLALLALTTKETSALQLFAYLVAFAFVHRQQRKWWWWVGGYLITLIAFTLPMHFVTSENMHAFTVWGEGFHWVRVPAMVLHTGFQLVFLASISGALLIGFAALRKTEIGSKLRLGVWLGLTALIFFMPMVRYYSHFEAVMFSDWAWPTAALLVLTAGLIRLCFVVGKLERIALIMVLLTFAGFALAPIVLRFARADVSARIFAACLVVIHGLIWRELVALWFDGQRFSRGISLVLGGLFVLFGTSAAFNAISFHRARLPVERDVKTVLANDLRMACPAIVNTNPVQWLAVEEIRALGGKRLGDCAWIQTTSANPGSGQSLDEFASNGGISVDKGQDAYLYIATARSNMNAEANKALEGDFLWTRELMPESDDDLIESYQRMIYEIETDLEAMFKREGVATASEQSTYIQLPLWWNELPRRLITGVPLLESYEFIGRLYRIPARQPGWRPEGGRRRVDKGPSVN